MSRARVALLPAALTARSLRVPLHFPKRAPRRGRLGREARTHTRADDTLGAGARRTLAARLSRLAVSSHQRILFLAYTPILDGSHTRFHHLSAGFEGTIVAPAPWPGTTSRSENVGRFRYLEFPARRRTFWSRLREIVDYVRATRRTVAQGARYDIIVASGLFKTAIAGLIIRRLIARPLIVELPVVPRKIALHRVPGPSLFRLLRALAIESAAALILGAADHIKQIFPGQAEQVSRRLAGVPQSAFPDFTPVGAIEPCPLEEFLLLIGTPLYLKGADLAIRAFRSLLPEFRHERLVIVGSERGFDRLRPLFDPADPIELTDYLPHDQAVAHIRAAKIVLIPSRTDAMPRVAIEAMAAGKAIVASRVDGMSRYLEHDRTALLCNPEDPVDLAARVRELLLDPARRRRLGSAARVVANRDFDEQAYTRNFTAMIRRCCDEVGGS
jgi:glycosyltransferase involved in cell wall biosynthesis